MYEGQEDEKLMALYIAGDELAFREIFVRYKARVYGYLYRMTRNDKVAEDLLQIVFMKLHRSRSRFDEARVFAAWLFAISRNVARDYSRRERRRPEINVEVPEDTAEGVPPEEETSSEIWKSVLQQMSVRQRKALELRIGENLEFSEIAKELKTNEANARQIISRAIRKIRDLLK